MQSQRHLFSLPPAVHYLNCGYMSPLLKAAEEAGIAGLQRKRNPALFKPIDFFNEAEIAKEQFGRLVNCIPQQVAVIASASYGLASAISNIPANKGTHAITIADEFPSDYYTLQAWCRKEQKELKIVQAPPACPGRGLQWTEQLIAAINKDTAAVVMSAIHWTDGTRFDLQRIGEKCRQCDALFIVDGTQAAGALPIDVKAFHIDALVCACYKWLLGPYSIGLAYYSDYFNTGTPIEYSWMNRTNAEDFSKLASYEDVYKPGAARYSVGESGNFTLLPMVITGLSQVLAWQPQAIQDYCRELVRPLVQFLQANGYAIEEEPYRTSHLFGFLLPEHINRQALLQSLQRQQVYISLRGEMIRVSPHVHNTAEDIEALIEVLKK